MGAQKTPIQKTYEIKKGSDSLNIEFLGANRQFDWIDTYHHVRQLQQRASSPKHKNPQTEQLYGNLQSDQREKIQHRQLDPKTFTLQTVCGLAL